MTVAHDPRQRTVDTLTTAMSALADPSLVGTGVHRRLEDGLRGMLRGLPPHPADRDARVGAAIRTACAHLAADRAEDAFIALQCARDQYPGAAVAIA
jgi:hypothetical protein